MRTIHLAIGAATAALLLSGCSPAQPGATPAPSAAAATTATPTPTPTVTPEPVALPQDFTLPPKSGTEPQLSAHGKVIKKTGELAGYTDTDGVTPVVAFTINAITPDFACTGHAAPKPVNGHFVAVEILAKTEADLGKSADSFLHTGPGNWKVIGPNGVTISTEPITPAAQACAAAATRLPAEIGPGEKARGYVILDVPVTSGTIILTPPSMPTVGWEWAFPAGPAS